MSATPEDKRQAASMAATLSAQLITAALGMIALQGAYVAFAADKKQCGATFWTLMLLAFLGFVASVYCAGKGTTEIYKNGGKNGEWESNKDHFRWQAIICLFGISLFILAVFMARRDKPSDTETVQKELETTVQALQKQSAINEQVLSQLRTNSVSSEILTQLADLKKRLDQLENQALKVRQTTNRAKTPLRSPKARSNQPAH